MKLSFFNNESGGKITANLLIVALLIFTAFSPVFPLINPKVAEAASTINYQGKLLTSGGTAVPNDTYNIEFKLYTTSTGGSPIWTETRTGSDKVQLTSGLFSVLLGEVTSLSGVDFDQDLYLGVNIGGTSTPSWDGEMTPRKKLASVPSAFVADTAKGLNSVNASTTNLVATNSTTTNATITNANVSSSLTVGSLNGLLFGTSGLVSAIATSSLGLLTTNVAEGTNKYYTDARARAAISSSATGLTYTSGTGDFSLTPGYEIPLSASTTAWEAKVSSQWTTTGSDIYYTTGNVGIGTTTPDKKLSVAGDINFTGTLYKNGVAVPVSPYILDGNHNISSSISGVASSGTDNYFSGYQAAGAGTSEGNANIFMGAQSGYANTSGYSNIGLGTATLINNTVGTNNIALGYYSGRSIVSGHDNIFSGSQSGYSTNTGYENIFTGVNAGYTNTGGYENFFSGSSAGYSNTSGAYNIFLGYGAGDTNVDGNFNIIIGKNADVGTTTLTNAVAIGNNAEVDQSYSMVLGGTGGDAVNVGIGTSSPSQRLDIWGNLVVGTSSTPAFLVNTATGNVGVGTSTANSKLSVSGDINFTGALKTNGSAGTAGYVLQTTGTGAAWVATSTLGYAETQWTTVGSDIYYNTGNVGIGVTSPAHLLDLGNAFVDSDGSASFASGGATIDNSGSLFAHFGSFNDGVEISGSNAYVIGQDFIVQNSGDKSALYRDGSAMFATGNATIDASGNGTFNSLTAGKTNSGPKLDVDGHTRLSDANDSAYFKTSGTSLNTGNWVTALGDVDNSANGNMLSIRNSGIFAGDVSSFNTGTVLAIDPTNSKFTFMSGDVGIGTTSPQTRLQVFGGTSAFNHLSNPISSNTNYSAADLVVGDNISTRDGFGGTNGSSIFMQSSDKSSITALDDGNNLGQISYRDLKWTLGEDVGYGAQNIYMPGKVGVNNGSPAVKLEVTGGSDSTATDQVFRLSQALDGGVAYERAATFSIRRWEVNSVNPRSALDIGLAHATTDGSPDATVMSLLSNGNVGIGTSSPSRTLTVNGSSDLGTNASAGSFTAASTTATSTFNGNLTVQTAAGTYGTYDVALNQPSTQSTTFATYFAKFANDGDSSTFQSTNGFAAPTNDYWTVDLGQSLPIGRVRILKRQTTTPQDFKIQACTDYACSSPTDLVTKSGETGLDLTYDVGTDPSAFPVSTRYLRIYDTTSGQGLNLFEVYIYTYTQQNVLHTDIANQRVGINNATPQRSLDVVGDLGASNGYFGTIFSSSLVDPSNSSYFVTPADSVQSASFKSQVLAGYTGAASPNSVLAVKEISGYADSIGITDSTGAYCWGTQANLFGSFAIVDRCNSGGVALKLSSSDGSITTFGHYINAKSASQTLNDWSEAAGQTADILVTRDSSNNLLDRIDAAGSLVINPGSGSLAARLGVIGKTTDAIPLFEIASSTGVDLVVDNRDHVGIGTATPAYKLDVYGNFNVATSATSTLFVNTARSRVGVGTSNPQYNLHVFGTGSDLLGVGDANDNAVAVNFSAGRGYVGYDVGNVILQGSGGKGLKLNVNNGTFGNGNGTALTITSTANVGIGTTTPGSLLDVWGNLNVGTSSTPTLFANTATGNVGIGTSSPQVKFSVGGNEYVAGMLEVRNPTEGALIIGNVSGNARGTAAVDIQGARGVAQVASGASSIAIGSFNTASATSSVAIGQNNTASKFQAVAIGGLNSASNQNASAIGYNNTASGTSSAAFGFTNVASGLNGAALGTSNISSGQNASALGYLNTASSTDSTAVGSGNQARNTDSSAFGYANLAAGNFSSALGFDNQTSNTYASAIGAANTAADTQSSAIGAFNAARAANASAIGFTNTANAVDASALGYRNTASYQDASAVGNGNSASQQNASAFGYNNLANNVDSSAFGSGNSAGGQSSTALGNINSALAYGTIAAGYQNFAVSLYDSSVGYNNTVNGQASSAFGYQNYFFTSSSTVSSSAFGYVNYVHGNYNSALGANNLTSDDYASAVGYNNTAAFLESSAVGFSNTSNASYTSSFGHGNTSNAAYAVAVGTSNTSSGAYAAAFGYNNTASNSYALASGYGNTSSATFGTAVGMSNNVTNLYASGIGMSNAASGADSSAFGYENTASDLHAAAFGFSSNATAQDTSAFGNTAIANALRGSAFGYGTHAYAADASAFGDTSEATGQYSSSVGYANNATGISASAFGTANYAATSTASAFGYFNTASAQNASVFGSNITNSVATSTMIGPTNAAKVTILGAAGSVGFVGIGTSTPLSMLDVWGNLRVGTSSTPTLFVNSATGKIGIGTSTPDQALVASGTIRATNLLGGATTLSTDASGNIIRTPSDVNLKEEITPISDALDKVNALEGVTFFWKDKARFGDQQEIGLIAQQVEQIVPQVVRDGGEYKSVNYPNLVALLIEAIKELSAKTANVFKWFAPDGSKVQIQGQVCVDDVCVSKEQFKAMLINSGSYTTTSSAGYGSSGESGTVSDGSSDSTTTATTTDNSSGSVSDTLGSSTDSTSGTTGDTTGTSSTDGTTAPAPDSGTTPTTDTSNDGVDTSSNGDSGTTGTTDATPSPAPSDGGTGA